METTKQEPEAPMLYERCTAQDEEQAAKKLTGAEYEVPFPIWFSVTIHPYEDFAQRNIGRYHFQTMGNWYLLAHNFTEDVELAKLGAFVDSRLAYEPLRFDVFLSAEMPPNSIAVVVQAMRVAKAVFDHLPWPSEIKKKCGVTWSATISEVEFVEGLF